MKTLATRSSALPDPAMTPENVGEIAVCMTDLRVRMDSAQERTRVIAAQRHEEYKYDLLELGWLLLRLRETHLCETVSHRQGADGRLQAKEGFHAQIHALWDENLQLRTAQNIMNLARNAGLTATSLRQEMLAKRQAEVLKGRKLQDLYRPPAGELGEGEEEPDFAQLRAEAELQTFRERFGHVTRTLLDRNLVEQLSMHELEAMDGQLIEVRRRIKARLQAA